MKKLWQEIKNRWKDVTAPSHLYCVLFNCCDCGQLVFTMVVRTISPEHAIQKAIDFLKMQDIRIFENTYMDVEQID